MRCLKFLVVCKFLLWLVMAIVFVPQSLGLLVRGKSKPWGNMVVESLSEKKAPRSKTRNSGWYSGYLPSFQCFYCLPATTSPPNSKRTRLKREASPGHSLCNLATLGWNSYRNWGFIQVVAKCVSKFQILQIHSISMHIHLCQLCS